MFFLLALGAMVILPLVLGYFGLSAAAEQIASIMRWPTLVLVVGFALAVLYRFGADRAPWRAFELRISEYNDRTRPHVEAKFHGSGSMIDFGEDLGAAGRQSPRPDFPRL